MKLAQIVAVNKEWNDNKIAHNAAIFVAACQERPFSILYTRFNWEILEMVYGIKI